MVNSRATKVVESKSASEQVSHRRRRWLTMKWTSQMRKGVDSLLEEQAYSLGRRRKKKAKMIMSAMAWAQAVLDWIYSKLCGRCGRLSYMVVCPDTSM